MEIDKVKQYFIAGQNAKIKLRFYYINFNSDFGAFRN